MGNGGGKNMKMLIDRNAEVIEHRSPYQPIEISRAGFIRHPQRIDHRDVLEGRVPKPDESIYEFDYYGYCWVKKAGSRFDSANSDYQTIRISRERRLRPGQLMGEIVGEK
jgi:hypothetical protein